MKNCFRETSVSGKRSDRRCFEEDEAGEDLVDEEDVWRRRLPLSEGEGGAEAARLGRSAKEKKDED